jgi:hypothetical protein
MSKIVYDLKLAIQELMGILKHPVFLFGSLENSSADMENTVPCLIPEA